MIIVSLTTIPTRFQYLYITIESILSQTIQPNKIIIHIPTKYNNYEYNGNMVPTFQSDKVWINHNTKDYGPATKLLGLYDLELYDNMSEDDIIIVIDDDRIYNNNLIKNMLNYHKIYSDKALTIAGWDIEKMTNDKYKINNKKQPRGIEFNRCGYVDILGGCCSFLLTKRMCPFNHKTLFDLHPTNDIYYVDDVWFSGYLTVNNIDIYIVPNTIFGDEMRQVNDSITPLYNDTRNEKNIKCIEYFRETYNIWN